MSADFLKNVGKQVASNLELHNILVGCYSIEDLPKIIDIENDIEHIFIPGLLRPFENPNLEGIFKVQMRSNENKMLVVLLFWEIYIIKFETSKDIIIESIRNQIAGIYSKLFSQIGKQKSELINFLLFADAYLCHYFFFKYFQKFRVLFNIRFILDCYHITIFELNGMFVSDHYVKDSIEKIFFNKFLSYENDSLGENKQGLVAQHSHFDKNFSKWDRSDGSLSFGGYSVLSHSDVTNMEGTIKYIANKFSKVEKITNSKPLQNYMNINYNSLEDLKKHFLVDDRMSYDKYLEKQKLLKEQAEHAKMIEQLKEQEKRENEEAATKTRASMANLKFDCCQISPTLAKYLSIPSMSLPVSTSALLIRTLAFWLSYPIE